MASGIKIGVKIIAGFVFAVALMAVVSLATDRRLVVAEAGLKEVSAVRLPAAMQLKSIDEAQTAVNGAINALFLKQLSDVQDRKALHLRMDKAWERMDKAWKTYEALPSGAEEEREWKALQAPWNRWRTAAFATDTALEERDAMSAAGASAEKVADADKRAWETFQGARAAFGDAESALSRVLDLNVELAQKAAGHAEAAMDGAVSTLIWASLAGALVLLFLGGMLFRSIGSILEQFMEQMRRLSAAVAEGRLDTRVDVEAINWEFRPIAEGVNESLDAVIKPLNVAAEYVNRIAKGDIPPKITDSYKGDFNEIKNNLNQCIDAVNSMVADAAQLSRAAVDGKLSTRADASKHHGDFRKIVQGVNDTLDSVIGPLNVAAEYVDRIAKGNIPSRITDSYKGDFNEIKNNLNQCIDAVNTLVADATMLSKAAVAGKLDTRADAAQHQGDFRKIVQGVNDTLDTVVDKVFWYEALLDAVPLPLSVTDMDMRWTFINKPVEQFLGLQRKDVLGQPCSNWSAPICKTENCGINCLRRGKQQTTFDQASRNFLVDSTYIVNRKGEKVGHVEVVQELTARIRAERYSKAEVEKVAGALRQLAAGNTTIDVRVAEADEHSKAERENFLKISSSLEQVRGAVDALVKDSTLLSKAAVEGKLSTRADVSKHQGDFRTIVQGVNNTLDAVIGPLNVAAEYVDRIAKGDIPPKIQDNYNGDFNEIKNNLNTCVDSLSGLIAEMNRMSKAHDAGDIDASIPVERFQGAYAVMAGGVNTMVGGHIAVKKKAMACVGEFGRGNFEAPLERFPGKKAFINETIEQVRTNLKALIADATLLSKAAVDGKLATRADATKHQGDFRRIVQGVNDTLDAVIGPLNVAAEYVDRIAKGDIPPKITDSYAGDFNEIKNNLNTCVDSLSGLVAEMNRMSKAHDAGDIDASIPVERFQGAYAVMAGGVNTMVGGHIAVKKKAMACVGEFGRGNFEAPLERFPGKKAFINETIEQVRTNLKALIADATLLSKAAVDGKLATRADATKHQGDFRRIVQGVNDTLDAVIGPLNVAAGYVDRISKGDIPAKITDNYNGDFNAIKSNLNQCVDAVNALVADAVMLSKAAVDGKLSTRADAAKHQGDFRKIVQGVNETLDSVINPLKVAATYVDRISKGDIPAKITDSYSGDFNTIKNNLNTCVDAVNSLVADADMLARAAVEGKLTSRADAARHGGDFRKVVEGVNKTLDAVLAPINEAAHVLEKLSQRDLRARVSGAYLGDHAKIKESVNATATALHDALAQVAESVGQVSSAAGQIASSSQAVADGASQQASALEETSSSLESMASMTRASADNAQQANGLATTANTAANAGNSAMEQMIGAMHKIRAAAEGTSQIIKDINEIAFQTNLLALNAAVEAARAGDAGRGFAVVAEEVRSLALRSKEAAMKTEELIKESVRQAGEGEQTSKQVSAQLTEIVSVVTKVSGIVAEIAASSKEQSAGIEQVTKAVGQMDKVTQQNAANSEESSSAAAELSGQSEELAAMVSSFQLNHVNNGAARRAAPAATAGNHAKALGSGRRPKRLAASTIPLTAAELQGANGDELGEF